MNTIAVIFDMDGVICHTNPHHAEAFKRFFKEKGVAINEDEFVDHMYGKHNSYIMRHFFKRDIDSDELLVLENEKEALFREIYADIAAPIPGFLEFLAALEKAHIKTAVATSAPRANLDLIMDKLGFESKMASILSSENVTNHKPDPEVYLKSAQNLGVEPGSCVVFEDSFSGVTAAKNAGMKVVAVLSSHSREELPVCDGYVQDYRDLSAESIIKLLNN